MSLLRVVNEIIVRMCSPLGWSFLTIQRPLFFVYTRCTDAIENCSSAFYVSAALPYSRKLPTWVLLLVAHRVRSYSPIKSLGCNDVGRQLHIFHYLDASWSTLRSSPMHTGSQWLFSKVPCSYWLFPEVSNSLSGEVPHLISCSSWYATLWCILEAFWLWSWQTVSFGPWEGYVMMSFLNPLLSWHRLILNIVFNISQESLFIAFTTYVHLPCCQVYCR